MQDENTVFLTPGPSLVSFHYVGKMDAPSTSMQCFMVGRNRWSPIREDFVTAG